MRVKWRPDTLRSHAARVSRAPPSTLLQRKLGTHPREQWHWILHSRLMTTSPTTTAAPALEFSDLPEVDQLAVLHTLGALQQGFAERDADRLVDVYADDADWVNAFGTSKRGVHEIIDYLHGLFADDNFNAGTVVKGPDISIRVLRETSSSCRPTLSSMARDWSTAAPCIATTSLYEYSNATPTGRGRSCRKCSWTRTPKRRTRTALPTESSFHLVNPRRSHRTSRFGDQNVAGSDEFDLDPDVLNRRWGLRPASSPGSRSVGRVHRRREDGAQECFVDVGF